MSACTMLRQLRKRGMRLVSVAAPECDENHDALRCLQKGTWLIWGGLCGCASVTTPATRHDAVWARSCSAVSDCRRPHRGAVPPRFVHRNRDGARRRQKKRQRVSWRQSGKKKGKRAPRPLELLPPPPPLTAHGCRSRKKTWPYKCRAVRESATGPERVASAGIKSRAYPRVVLVRHRASSLSPSLPPLEFSHEARERPGRCRAAACSERQETQSRSLVVVSVSRVNCINRYTKKGMGPSLEGRLQSRRLLTPSGGPLKAVRISHAKMKKEENKRKHIDKPTPLPPLEGTMGRPGPGFRPRA
ncbi:hypothetical protein LZ30DRAFT_412559 [Colletotrichum cereale]|nr:hypothetical protein LZ30DRAFT_412559 [Colletotrichum cereale]